MVASLNIAGEKFVGAYPVRHHGDCANRTRMDVSGPVELQAPPSDALLGRMEDGNIFEDEMIEHMLGNFNNNGWDVISIDCTGTRRKAFADALTQLESRVGSRSKKRFAVNITLSGRNSEQEKTVLRTKAQAMEITLAALAAGAHVIFGGRLNGNGRVGEPDILVRENPEEVGRKKYSYLGGDFKDHKSFQGSAKAREWVTSTLDEPFLGEGYNTPIEAVGTPQKTDSMQLVHYWYLLEAHGYEGAKQGFIIGRELTPIWRDLTETMYAYRKKSAFDISDELFEDYWRVRNIEEDRLLNPSIEAPASPEWQSACVECPWRDVCKAELQEERHITLLTDITKNRAQAHYEAGVSRIEELALLDPRTARLIDADVDVQALMDAAFNRGRTVSIKEIAARAKDVIALRREGIRKVGDVSGLDPVTATYSKTRVWNLSGSIDQARVTIADRVHRKRGVTEVNLPRAAVELDIDIEDADGVCYLIGVRRTVRDGRKVASDYVPFVTWEHTPEAEAQNFVTFWNYVQEEIADAVAQGRDPVRCYYYTDHETRYFKHIVRTNEDFDGMPSMVELEEFFESIHWIDMYPIMGKELIWPCENRSLKTLAKYAKFMWRDETPGGAESVVWYLNQMKSEDPVEVEALQQRLLDYNEDDVEATYAVRDFLSRLGMAHNVSKKLPSAADLDRKYAARAASSRKRRRAA